jgi:hypothetical protein
MPTYQSRLFAIASVLTAVYAAAWLAATELMLTLWGTPQPDAMTVYMSRRYAVMFVGYSLLLWMARGLTAPPAPRVIAAGGTAVTGAMALLSAWGALSGVAGPIIWSVVAVEVILSVCFARLWLRG